MSSISFAHKVRTQRTLHGNVRPMPMCRRPLRQADRHVKIVQACSKHLAPDAVPGGSPHLWAFETWGVDVGPLGSAWCGRETGVSVARRPPEWWAGSFAGGCGCKDTAMRLEQARDYAFSSPTHSHRRPSPSSRRVAHEVRTQRTLHGNVRPMPMCRRPLRQADRHVKIVQACSKHLAPDAVPGGSPHLWAFETWGVDVGPLGSAWC